MDRWMLKDVINGQAKRVSIYRDRLLHGWDDSKKLKNRVFTAEPRKSLVLVYYSIAHPLMFKIITSGAVCGKRLVIGVLAIQLFEQWPRRGSGQRSFWGKMTLGYGASRCALCLSSRVLAMQSKTKEKKGKPGEEGDEKSLIKKQEIVEKAHGVIILCLADNVLREVSRETTAAVIWTKLESLYMTKSLANRLFTKHKLYSYKFLEERSISEQLDEYNKSVDDLENIDVKLEDEDKVIILLSALPKSFDHLRDAMLYGRENTITLEEV